MPRIKLRSQNKELLDKVEEIIQKTKIIRKQVELSPNRWDFVVFGPQQKDSSVIREGYAEHLRIYNSPVYSMSLGNPSVMEVKGIPIEEFAKENIPPELEGLNVYQVDPLRPLKIEKLKKGPVIERALDMVEEEYEGRNIALIQTPSESYWVISVLHYLAECDRYFPDFLTESIRQGKLSFNVNFLSQSELPRLIS